VAAVWPAADAIVTMRAAGVLADWRSACGPLPRVVKIQVVNTEPVWTRAQETERLASGDVLGAELTHGVNRSGKSRMSKYFACLAFILALAPLSQAHADERLLAAGRYDVDVRLELPHVEDLNMKKTTAICVMPDDGGSRGLAVLGDNNPLSHCPASNIRQDGSILTFDIVCEGTNAARASASYTLSENTFRGRITMKMGGKNMTMSETQVGHRVGACSEAASHS